MYVKDVLEEIILARGVKLLRILVMKVKETVMDLVIEVSMMIMLGVKEPLSVVPTTVNYLATIIPYEGLYDLLGPVSGPFSPCAVESVDMVRRTGPGGVLNPTVGLHTQETQEKVCCDSNYKTYKTTDRS